MRLLPRNFLKYSWAEFAGDISGGFLAALIALPYGLAMASLMELPPILGIFTSILTAPFTAMLGRNPVLIGGASSVTVPFVAAAVKAQGIGGGAKVTIVAAVTMLVFSVLRLGRFASKVPNPVMAGFSCGIGMMMVISQLKTIFGLRIPRDADMSMVGLLAQNFANLGSLQWNTTITALLVIVTAFWIASRFPKLPAPLLAILLAVSVSNYFGWAMLEIGVIPKTVPPFAGFSWSPTDVYTVLPSGLMLGFVASVNLLVTSRVVYHFRGKHQAMKQIDSDRELGAYGIANLAAGMFGAPMSVGIPARSLANVRCGGSTRVSNIAHAAALLIAVIYLGKFLEHIPLSALAGVTAWMGFSLMGWSTWARLPKMRRTDAAGFLLTAFTILFWNAVAAIAVGCCVYVAAYVRNHVRNLRPLAVQATR